MATVARGTRRAWPRPGRARGDVLLPSGVTRTGAVEVHLRASDFVRHGHRDDPAYATVVLHLVWEDDRVEAGTPTALPGADRPRPSRWAPYAS